MVKFLLLLLPFSLCAYEGVFYKNIVTNTPQSIHLLEIDPETCTIVPKRALDSGIGRESVSSLAERHGAIAAVNGGFFAIGGTYEGIPCGILKIDGKWYGLGTKPRGAIGWKKGSSLPHFDRLVAKAKVEINHTSIDVDGINQPRKENEITLFSSDFSFTTLTKPGGKEVVLQHGRVKALTTEGSTPIPQEGWVLSIGKERVSEIPPKALAKYQKATTHFEITPQIGSEEWNAFDHIVGGTPLLIYDGKRIEDLSPEKTIESFRKERHARTAVGLLPNHHWLFVVVDGKQPEYSVGMTIEELTTFMEEQGCLYALNLDGGGSSTLFYDGAIVNHPMGDSDENQGAKVRKVSDAILILQ